MVADLWHISFSCCRNEMAQTRKHDIEAFCRIFPASSPFRYANATMFQPFDFPSSGTQAHINYIYAESLQIVYERDISVSIHNSTLDNLRLT